MHRSVMPRDDVEVRVAQAWQDVLGVRAIGVTDDFFEVGGDSLTAVRLAIRLQKDFQCDLSIESVLRATTVERMASVLRQPRESESNASLVAIQSKGARLPLFCVHPIGGSVACYAELALSLGLDQPFYGFQASGGDTSLESMASRYVEEMLRLQPQGPYLLAGASMGGVVAFEIAQQLYRREKEVALVALFDASPGATPWSLAGKEDHGELIHRFALELASILGKSDLAVRPSTMDELSELFSSDLDPVHVRRLFETFVANLRALQAYTPIPYPGGLVLFRAREERAFGDESLGWQDLAQGDVEIEVVPGNHFSMLRRPHVEFLAQRMTTYLAKRENRNHAQLLPNH
jgi:thioesterase domain-containing protein/acyl carrier protein